MDQLLTLTSQITLETNQVDMIKWRWTKNDIFTVHSFYLWLNDEGLLSKYFEIVWRPKISIKI
jgi:hypothetical protein